MLWAFCICVCVCVRVVCPGEMSRLVGAIKVSRTLGQSQLNFAHTFFGSLSLTRAGAYQGSPRPSSRDAPEIRCLVGWRSRRQTSRVLVNR